jgi:hypothetical protein
MFGTYFPQMFVLLIVYNYHILIMQLHKQSTKLGFDYVYEQQQ